MQGIVPVDAILGSILGHLMQTNNDNLISELANLEREANRQFLHENYQLLPDVERAIMKTIKKIAKIG